MMQLNFWKDFFFFLIKLFTAHVFNTLIHEEKHTVIARRRCKGSSEVREGDEM